MNGKKGFVLTESTARRLGSRDLRRTDGKGVLLRTCEGYSNTADPRFSPGRYL